MFDLRKIEAFCKVCERRSFSKAGEALFLSQPTVSAHIQSLERLFGVRLLDRMGRTVLPTPAGAVLYRYAKQAFARLETARAEINALAQEVTGDLRIGSNSICALHILPEILAGFIELHPKVHPSLTVDSSASITRLVLEGELMGGIVGTNGFTDPDIISFPIVESEIIIIAPPHLDSLPENNSSDGSEALPEISFHTACSLHWIMRENKSTTSKAFQEALRLAGHDTRFLQTRLAVDSSHAAVQYVRAGLGVSVAARIAVQPHLESGDIRACTIAGVKAVRQFVFIMNARRLSFPAANVFQKFLLAGTAHLRPLQIFSDPMFHEL